MINPRILLSTSTVYGVEQKLSLLPVDSIAQNFAQSTFSCSLYYEKDITIVDAITATTSEWFF
jgi:hypothetical protein